MVGSSTTNFYSDGQFIYINTPYAEAYIAAELFDSPDKDPTKSSIAYLSGDSVVSMGIMYMRFFNSENYNRDEGEVRTLNYPNMIELQPSSISGKMDLTINGQTDKYVVLKFEKGDILMAAASKQASTNVEKFVKLVLSGKIPRSLKYDDVYLAWKKNSIINGFNMQAPDVAIQTIVSEMCRDPNNLLQQFRKIAGKQYVDPYSYKMLNMNTISAYSSVMSSMSFERFAEKLTTSINMTKANVDQKPSPLEKVLIM